MNCHAFIKNFFLFFFNKNFLYLKMSKWKLKAVLKQGWKDHALCNISCGQIGV